MSPFLIAVVILLIGLLPCGWVVWKHPPVDGLVAFELASNISAGILLMVGEATRQPSVADLAIALAVLSLGGSLVYARFLEQWV